MTKRQGANWLVALLALAVLGGGWVGAASASAGARISVLTVDGAIGPATADYIARGITRAAAAGDALVILQLDTPGGLDTSMRIAIKAILSSPVPVAVYIAPSGARAASAGTYLLYASHIAAMAPGTNLGAATPVPIGIAPAPTERRPAPARGPPQPGGTREPAGDAEGGSAGDSAMTRKGVNDAAAYLRGLAQLRGRNAAWAERAVREAVSLTAQEALKENVIELIAADIPALVAQLDGRTVSVLGQQRRLHTAGAAIAPIVPDWRTEALSAITHPGVALILMTIGIYGLLFEFMSPGFVLPGVIGAICLLLGLYALQLLPVNYAGLALILLGLLFMGAEAFVPSFGILGFGGVIAFVVGGLILIDTDLPGYGVPPLLIGTLGIAAAVLTIGVVRMALNTRRRPVTSGAAGMIGEVAQVNTLAHEGGLAAWVQVQGEQWHAECEVPLRPKQLVRIVARRGLHLKVVPIENHEAKR